MPKYLVIVESPAKTKTINKFLGRDYVILSSMGHVIDLPKSEMGVDIENNFKPRYIVMAKRRKILSELKKSAKGKDCIYLAMDPDREGEAIAYNLKQQLQSLTGNIYRVTFNEITEKTVKAAFNNIHGFDIDRVNAQQARRILDRVVGYSLSPLLWKKVSRGLSAGRVQSVALRLIVEREKKIKAFVPEEYWEMEALLKKDTAVLEDAKLSGDNREAFRARLVSIEGKKPELKTKKPAEELKEELKNENFIVEGVKETKKRRSPFPPYITSTMQQDAFNRLGFLISRTMKMAQELYEGIELGDKGTMGLITYMRTDSVRLSNEAQAEARNYIIKKFGKSYSPASPRKFKSKKRTQEAHEAIRPALPLMEPASVKEHLTAGQFKLYELIWNRFIASQMESSLNLVVSVDIRAGRCVFRAGGARVLFNGFTALYQMEKKKEACMLPALSEKEVLHLIELEFSQHFTNPPPRFSDASLVKALEEKGIGRPSTYAPVIFTIILRNYVERIKGYFHPTELGTIVTELLTKYFPKVLDIKFTAYLEDELDKVEDGKADWAGVLKDFYAPFKIACDKAHKHMKNVKEKIMFSDEVCEKCGKPMVIKWGRNGKFLSCSDFPKCRNAKSITTGIKCPQPDCGGELVKRRSKRGPFYGCTNFPKCHYTSRSLPSEQKKPVNPLPSPLPSPQRGEGR